jgi:hypothetical protein
MILDLAYFRVTYSLDHNFIIRHMPGRVHEATIRNWDIAFTDALRGLIAAPTEPGIPGCKPVGSTSTFNWVFNSSFRSPVLPQPLTWDRGRNSQIVVSSPLDPSIPALSSRSGAPKVLVNCTSMPSFGLNARMM